MKIITLFICIILSHLAISQNFIISNGYKIKTIKQTDFVNLTYGDISNNICCNKLTITGNINSESKDSIYIKANTIEVKHLFKDGNVDFGHINQVSLITPIAKSDILSLSATKSEKIKKIREGFLGPGGILIVTGIVTGLNALIVPDKTSKNNLLVSGGIQFGVGLAFAVISNPKKYHFNNAGNAWKFQ